MTERSFDSEPDIDGEEEPGGPKLPFRPTAGETSDGSVSTATFTSMAERFAPPPDDGAPPNPHPNPNAPKPTPPTTLEILSFREPPPNTSGLGPTDAKLANDNRDARFRIRADGFTLLQLGGSASAPNDRQKLLELATPVFRHNLAEFYTYMRLGLETQLEIDDPERHQEFVQALADDGRLTAALKTWAEFLSRGYHDWPPAADALNEVADQLEALKKALAGYSSTRIESVLGNVLDAIGHEIARQTASFLRNGPIDLAERYTGVIMATRLASPSQATVDGYYQALIEAPQGQGVNVAEYSLSKQLLSALSQANNAAKAAGRRDDFFVVDKVLALKGQARASNTTEWVADLLDAAEALGNESRGWDTERDQATGFAQALSNLDQKLRAAGNEIANAGLPPGARRIAERSLAALAIAVANRIKVLAETSIPAKKLLSPTATKLSRDFSRPAIDGKLSDYWADKSKAALANVPDADRRSFTKQWFSDNALSDALSDWSKQMALLNSPGGKSKHSPGQLLDACWRITNTLNRYRLAADTLKSADARQQLLDALDDIAAYVAKQMDDAQRKWKREL